jgi:hypothetical protein
MTAALGLLLALLLALAPVLASLPAEAHGQDMAVTLADPGAELPQRGALPDQDQAGRPCSPMPACPMAVVPPAAESSGEPGPGPGHGRFVPLVRPTRVVQPDPRPPIA